MWYGAAEGCGGTVRVDSILIACILIACTLSYNENIDVADTKQMPYPWQKEKQQSLPLWPLMD